MRVRPNERAKHSESIFIYLYWAILETKTFGRTDATTITLASINKFTFIQSLRSTLFELFWTQFRKLQLESTLNAFKWVSFRFVICFVCCGHLIFQFCHFRKSFHSEHSMTKTNVTFCRTESFEWQLKYFNRFIDKTVDNTQLWAENGARSVLKSRVFMCYEVIKSNSSVYLLQLKSILVSASIHFVENVFFCRKSKFFIWFFFLPSSNNELLMFAINYKKKNCFKTKFCNCKT